MTVNPSRSDVRLRPGRDSRSLGWKVPFSPGVTVAHLPGEKDTSERWGLSEGVASTITTPRNFCGDLIPNWDFLGVKKNQGYQGPAEKYYMWPLMVKSSAPQRHLVQDTAVLQGNGVGGLCDLAGQSADTPSSPAANPDITLMWTTFCYYLMFFWLKQNKKQQEALWISFNASCFPLWTVVRTVTYRQDKVTHSRILSWKPGAS